MLLGWGILSISHTKFIVNFIVRLPPTKRPEYDEKLLFFVDKHLNKLYNNVNNWGSYNSSMRVLGTRGRRAALLPQTI